jgi:hypothetical protein
MELKAKVRFEDGEAQYKVSPDRNGIFQARLEYFNGNSQRTPPQEIILVRGYRQWSGSYDRQDFLNQLGSAIETEREYYSRLSTDIIDPSNRPAN